MQTWGGGGVIPGYDVIGCKRGDTLHRTAVIRAALREILHKLASGVGQGLKIYVLLCLVQKNTV